MKHKLLIVAVVLFMVSAVFAVSVLAVNSDGGLDNESVSNYASTNGSKASSLHIPEADQIKTNGYPTNEYGESYGPDIYENTNPEFEPDLILAQNKDGVVGYIKRTDIKGGASSLEEALNWVTQKYTVPMYLEDGITIIGEFQIG